MVTMELLERVRTATGPDRELDEAIALATSDHHEFAQLADAPEGVGCMMYRHGHSQLQSALRVTASIDAAIALVERVLPGWQVNLSAFGNMAEASVGGRGVYPSIQAPTPPLAILAALLTALIAKEPS